MYRKSDLSISNVAVLDGILWTLVIEGARKGRGFVSLFFLSIGGASPTTR